MWPQVRMSGKWAVGSEVKARCGVDALGIPPQGQPCKQRPGMNQSLTGRLGSQEGCGGGAMQERGVARREGRGQTERGT